MIHHEKVNEGPSESESLGTHTGQQMNDGAIHLFSKAALADYVLVKMKRPNCTIIKTVYGSGQCALIALLVGSGSLHRSGNINIG